MTAAEAVSRRIHELVAPYLRIERAPSGERVRLWFGPHCWVDLDREGFERALERDPLPVDAEGRIRWEGA